MSATLIISSTACNIEGLPDDGDDPNIVIPPPAQNENADVQITVGTLGKKDETTLMNRWINAFNKAHADDSVNVKLTDQMQGMPDTTLWDAAGKMPDIIWTAGDQHSYYSGYYKYFQNLNDEEKFPGCTEFFADFYESMIETTHYSSEDDGIWFVPRDYNRLVIYINKTAFEQAGVAIPKNDWTWNDFISVCNQLMDKHAKKAIEWKKWRPVYSTMVQNFGAKYLNDNGTLAAESAQMEACADFYQKLYESKRSASDPAVGIAMPGEGENFMSYSIDTGIYNSIPMVVDVRPQLPSYMQTASNGGWELDVVAFPNYVQPDGSAGYVGAGCSGYGITKACVNTVDEEGNVIAKLDWAWKFLQFCMSKEGYEVVSDLGNIVPALKTLRNSGSWRDYTYSYGGPTVNAEAFVYEGTKDIFLNYQNALPVTKHDNFILRIDDFWKNVSSSGYAEAIRRLKSDFAAL